MKKHLLRIFVGLCIVAVFFFHERADYELPLVRKLENMVADARQRLTLPGGVDPSVVILDIDENSLKEREHGGEGRWPWPRDRLALLMDKLFDQYQIEVLGFDVVFAERDETSGVRVLDRLARHELSKVTPFLNELERLRPTLDYDALFASKLKNRKIVLGYTFNDEKENKGLLPNPVFDEAYLGGHKIPPAEARSGYSGNIKVLQESVATGGHFNPANDIDGVLRKVPMVIPFAGKYYESLSLAMVRSYLGMPPVKLLFAEYSSGEAELEELSIGGLTIPVDNKARALIPYRGPRGSFKYISIADLMNDQVEVSALRGKLVLLGVSAPGLMDLRVTPVGAVYPGVEAQANLVAGILDGKLKRDPAYADGLQLIVILLVGVALAVLLPCLRAISAIALTAGIAAAVIGVNLALYQYGHFVLPVAGNVILIFALFTLNTVWGYFAESRSKRQITAQFGQYVPPEIAEQIAKDPRTVSFEPTSRECTVLFTDVRGFTTISEGLDPKALSELMNEFLTPLTEVIFKYNGTIDKYMGDCIMAFWGAPLDNPAHAHVGVLAGLEMHRVLAALQPKFKEKNWPEIKIGVGLNTGRVSVGNMGSQIRRAYTVMGDAVNLASRLEGITKEYGVDIIVGEETMKAAPDIVFRELDRVRVKGKENAVTIFQPMGLRSEVSTDTVQQLEVFQQALMSYRRQEWGEAETRLLHLQGASPGNKLYELFLSRIAVLREAGLESNWDGAFTLETK